MYLKNIQNPASSGEPQNDICKSGTCRFDDKAYVPMRFFDKSEVSMLGRDVLWGM